MPVYLIQVGEDGPIKIGHANDPWRRLSELQTSNPTPMRLLALLDGEEAEEAALHLRFQGLRIRGEWFDPSPELTALAAEHPPPAPPSRRDAGLSVDDDLSRIRDLLGLSQTGLAEQLGTTQASVSRWEQSGAPKMVLLAARYLLLRAVIFQGPSP